MVFVACGQPLSAQTTKDKPWNISIYLDLSDRLITGKGGTGDKQFNRDTTLISAIMQKFINNVIKHKIVPCQDRLQIFFYPSNGIPNASAFSQKLKLDLSDYNRTPAEKRLHLLAMKYGYQPNGKAFMEGMLPPLRELYTQTLTAKKWVGSDIYGFFQHKVKTQCLDTAYRNVLIILTDGYIYHRDNVSKTAEGYSYILSGNISEPNVKLAPCNTGLDDLEVLFLEINPSTHSHLAKM